MESGARVFKVKRGLNKSDSGRGRRTEALSRRSGWWVSQSLAPHKQVSDPFPFEHRIYLLHCTVLALPHTVVSVIIHKTLLCSGGRIFHFRSSARISDLREPALPARENLFPIREPPLPVRSAGFGGRKEDWATRSGARRRSHGGREGTPCSWKRWAQSRS